MNRRNIRTRGCIAAAGFVVAAMGYGPSAGATTCAVGSPEVNWVPGRYTNAHEGDVVVFNGIKNESYLYPIVHEMGESFVHVAMVMDNNGYTISENIPAPGIPYEGWDASHPTDPYDLGPVMPTGVLDSIYADGQSNYYSYYDIGYLSTSAPHANNTYAMWPARWATGYWGGVASQPVATGVNYFDEITGVQAAGGIVLGTEAAPVHAGGCPVTTANTWILGDNATTTHGYELYSLTHYVPNGNCVSFLTSTCGVTAPTPTSYLASQVADAMSALWSEVNSICWGNLPLALSGIDSFVVNLLGEKSSICDNASYEWVNTVAYNDPWENTAENYSFVVNTVVSPSKLESAYGGTKTPVATSAATVVDNGYCCEDVSLPIGGALLMEYNSAGSLLTAGSCPHETGQ